MKLTQQFSRTEKKIKLNSQLTEQWSLTYINKVNICKKIRTEVNSIILNFEKVKLSEIIVNIVP